MTLAYPLTDPRTARPSSALGEVIERLGVRMSYGREQEIYAQEDPVEFLYCVISGVVRTTRLTPDGRRLIGDFYYAGDIFGLEPGPDHQFGAEALSDCEVQVVRRAAARAHAGDAELNRAVLEATGRELARAQEHLMLLGRKTACEKVASFLLEMADRSKAEVVTLPMGRQDMADYLGLTIETVSRMLTQLQADGLVEFTGCRHFRIKHRAAMARLVVT